MRNASIGRWPFAHAAKQLSAQSKDMISLLEKKYGRQKTKHRRSTKTEKKAYQSMLRGMTLPA